jgi:serine protease Do
LKNNLAVNVPTIALGNSDRVRLAEPILTIGFPDVADININTSNEATINDGQISARKQSNTGSTLLQISAAVTHGNSGGPVLNRRGEAIGMVTLGAEQSGFAFAVSSNTILKLMQTAGITPTETLTLNLPD